MIYRANKFGAPFAELIWMGCTQSQVLVLFIAVAIGCCPTWGAPTTQPMAVGFLQESAATGLAIVQLTVIASTKADAPETRQFANEVLGHQASLNTEIKSTAEAHGITVSPTLSPAQQQALDDLKQKYGRPVDRAYLQQLIDLETELSTRAQAQRDGAFATLAAKMVSLANTQIAQAQKVAGNIGVKLNQDPSAPRQ